MRGSPNAREDMWRFVAKGDGCWEWKSCVNRSGYGMFSVRRRPYLAHRLAYELSVGPVPAPLRVLHRCDNPPCVRPSHLFLGTQRDNMRDMWAKGRGARGSRSGLAKLTEESVAVLFARRAAGEPVPAIAADLGISWGHAYGILRGRTWRGLHQSGGI